jgi:uncharacterized iron-regulated protein
MSLERIQSVGISLLLAVLMLCALQSSANAGSFLIDLLLGEPVPMGALVDDVSRVRIVYLGEIHTIARHHHIQAELLRELARGNLKLAVGMEMFAEDEQPALDRWQSGKAPLGSLMEDLGKGQWTNLRDYEPVLIAARESGATLVGLNADNELVRKVAREGVEGLSAADKARVPEGIEEINPLYDRLLRLKLRVHRAFQEKSLDRIVRAQALRDEIMARSVVRFLTSEQGKDRIMLVIAGAGHVNYGFGIPERVSKHLEVPHRIIIASESGELVLSEAEKRQAVPIEITHEDLSFIRRPIADYLHVIPLKDEKDEGEIPARQVAQ